MTNLNPLADYANTTVRALGADQHADNYTDEGANAYDGASDLAIDLLSTAGYEVDDPDALGADVTDDVQTLLILVMMRAPKLVPLLNRALV